LQIKEWELPAKKTKTFSRTERKFPVLKGFVIAAGSAVCDAPGSPHFMMGGQSRRKRAQFFASAAIYEVAKIDIVYYITQ